MCHSLKHNYNKTTAQFKNFTVHTPEEGVIVNAVSPKLFAAVVGVHVESHHILIPCALVWNQLYVELPPLVGDFPRVGPGREREGGREEGRERVRKIERERECTYIYIQ